MTLKANIEKISTQVSRYPATLIAVSKTKSATLIQEAYDLGIRNFGENKVQELVDKATQLPKDIHWHMIGHLQRNKVKYIAPFVYLIHGVDSLNLLKEINKQGKKVDRKIDCLLQVHIAEEETKFGFSLDEVKDVLEDPAFAEMKNIEIKGLMGMATFTENTNQVRKEFKALYELFNSLKSVQKTNVNMQTLSMGMSGDFLIAMEEGSTMVRVGSAIFGVRDR